MSVKPKRLVNPLEERLLEFLETCVEGKYRIHTQVSLSQICEQVSNLNEELRRFLFSASAVDALITDCDYMPCLVVERQSSYHDSREAKERDRKKAALLELAGVPLVYVWERNGLLHLSCKDEAVVLNLYTGQEQEKARALIIKYCQQSVSRGVQFSAG